MSTTGSSGTTEGSSSGGEEPIELGPFGEAEEVPGVNSGMGDDDPTLRADLLEIYFASQRADTEDIYRADRARIDDDFTDPQSMSVFNGPTTDTTPELSPDGLTLVFSRGSGADPNEVDLLVSTRRTINDTDWTTPVALDDLNMPDVDIGLTLTEDNLVGVLCRRVVGRGTADVYAVRRAEPESAFSSDALLTGFSGDGYNCNPWIHPSGRAIVVGRGSGGDLTDLVWAARDDVEDDFAAAVPVEGVNTESYEDDPWVSADGELIVFSRRGPSLSQRIYWAQRISR